MAQWPGMTTPPPAKTSATRWRWELTAASAQGPRKEQQDAWHGDARHLLVCDGLGGHRDGALAAATAKGVLAALPDADLDEDGYRALIRRAAGHVTALAEVGEDFPPGTTMAGALLTDGAVIVGWSGDSRVYAESGGELWQVTQDHAVWGLERCLGGGLDAAPETWILEPRAGDRYIAVTDGITDALRDNTLAVLADCESAQEVIEACKRAGLVDNTTVVVGTIVAVNDLGSAGS